ncbi:MAG: Flp pilus assembly protein CpaB [Vampirovibrionales bacterium]|nr:Flp pilus assembly protein CpaB [Vampirovibrionales bacterium]
MARLPLKANVLFLGVAGILAVITALMLGRVLENKQQQPTAPVAMDTLPVVVAQNELLPGVAITAKDIVVMDWPRATAMNAHNLFSDAQSLVGRVVSQPIHPNEPVTLDRLASATSKGGLPVLIPPGMRAVTVAVSEIVGVAGFVKPGDWVDVLATFEQGEGDKAQRITRTVLQRVQVLAIAQDSSLTPAKPAEADESVAEAAKKEDKPASTEKGETTQEASSASKEAKSDNGGLLGMDGDDPPPLTTAKIVTSVTLSLKPAQVETLTLADEAGSLRLSLRPEEGLNNRLIEPVKTNGVSISQLLGQPGASNTLGHRRPSASPSYSKPASKPVAPAGGVEFWDGGKRSTVSF